MPQFSPQSKRPLSPKTYAAAARMLRRSADALEARSTVNTAQDKRAVSRIINGLLHAIRALRDKHTARSSS